MKYTVVFTARESGRKEFLVQESFRNLARMGR